MLRRVILSLVAVVLLSATLAEAQAVIVQNTARRTITVASGPFGVPSTLLLEAGTLGLYAGSAFGNTSARSVQWCVAFDTVGQGWVAVMENAPAVYTTYAAVKSPDPVLGFPDMAMSPSYYCGNGK